MDQPCISCGHDKDRHTVPDGCTQPISDQDRLYAQECPCTVYCTPVGSIPEPSETPVKLTGKQVYVAARNYIANELQITSGQILEMMAKRADKVVLAFLMNHKESHWIRKYIREGIDSVIRDEVRKIL